MCLAYGRSRVRSSGPATFFRWDIGHEMISSAILSLPLIQEGQLPRNSVVTLTDRLDMTVVVGGNKTTNQTKQTFSSPVRPFNTLFI